MLLLFLTFKETRLVDTGIILREASKVSAVSGDVWGPMLMRLLLLIIHFILLLFINLAVTDLLDFILSLFTHEILKLLSLITVYEHFQIIMVVEHGLLSVAPP